MGNKIIVVGLGSGDEEQLSIGVFRKLKNSKNIYLRTEQHPVVSFLKSEDIHYITFDYLYDELTDYEKVYTQIASTLINKALEDKELVYAVPGNPMIAEKSVQILIQESKKLNVSVEVLGGESFLDTAFSRLQIDPIEGFLFLNGEGLKRTDLNPTKNTIIAQVYDNWIASEVKLTLMEIYPDDMPIMIISRIGMADEIIKQVLLYELDYTTKDFHHLSSIFVPKSNEERIFERQFTKVVETMEILRSPVGCPWDRAQTHQSIRSNLLEEAYELLETIDELDMEHMVEELGDVLLQVILHSQIATEEGYFDIFDVIQSLNQKLIRRHPHVFGNEKAAKAPDALAALERWDSIKKQEKAENGVKITSVLDGIPNVLPAIHKAYKLQTKAAKVSFDWPDIKQVYSKIDEELNELKNASKKEQAGELGDLLFAVVNLARFLKIDPELALEKTNKKFKQRFNFIEQKLKEKNVSFENATLELMDSFWEEAKNRAIKGE